MIIPQAVLGQIMLRSNEYGIFLCRPLKLIINIMLNLMDVPYTAGFSHQQFFSTEPENLRIPGCL